MTRIRAAVLEPEAHSVTMAVGHEATMIIEADIDPSRCVLHPNMHGMTQHLRQDPIHHPGRTKIEVTNVTWSISTMMLKYDSVTYAIYASRYVLETLLTYP